jgi:hypothetical protein
MSFTGEVPLPISWSVLETQYAQITDAFASPSGTLLALQLAETEAHLALDMPNTIRY